MQVGQSTGGIAAGAVEFVTGAGLAASVTGSTGAVLGHEGTGARHSALAQIQEQSFVAAGAGGGGVDAGEAVGVAGVAVVGVAVLDGDAGGAGCLALTLVEEVAAQARTAYCCSCALLAGGNTGFAGGGVLAGVGVQGGWAGCHTSLSPKCRVYEQEFE